MSGRQVKRPSSARRNIKQETFSPFVSLTRIRHVQSLLRGPGNSQSNPDAALCILGIDGRYNDGCLELANFILFNFFDSRKLELERSGYDEEVIDDMIFVIKSESVDVFCNPINYHYLLPYIAHWKNLHIHCINEADYENEEKAEEFKIRSFISMVDGCEKIGIPYCSSGQSVKFDKMLVEKWPIIQAFALEEYGGGGFFTLKYEVTDIGRTLHTIYHTVDPVFVEALVTEQLNLFERQWNNLLLLLDTDRKDRMKKVNEMIVSEPLRSYFNHGRMIGKGDGLSSDRFPFVSFGKNTLKNELKNYLSGGKNDCKANVYDTGITRKYATHMICQAVSPRGPISCTRTYFFTSGNLPHPACKAQAEKLEEPQRKNYDTKLLMSLYSACVSAVIEAIYVYANSLDPQQAEERAKEVLQNHCQAQDVPLNPSWFENSKNVEFKMSGFDNSNRSIPITKQVPLPLVKTASVTIFDIPSLEKKGEKLGSVSFAESFIESSIFALRADGSHELDGEYMILTSRVERYISWQVSKQEFEYNKVQQDVLSSKESDLFGSQIVRGESALLALDDTPSTIVKGGNVHLFDNGIVYCHPHQGSIVLPKAELSAIHLYDGDSPSIVTLLIVNYRENLSQFLPSHLRSKHNRLIIAFLPKTKAYKQLTSQVLPVWKEDEKEPQIQRIEELPDEMEAIHAELQAEFVAQSKSLTNISPLKKAKAQMPNLDKFLNHFCVSSVGKQSVPVKHVQACIGGNYDEGGFSDQDEVVLTILGGIPGSHKESLCHVLKGLTQEDSKWKVLKPPVGGVDHFNPRQLYSQLYNLCNNLKRHREAGETRKMRVLLLSPGFTDTIELVQKIVTHPEPIVTSLVKIGAVSVCIDPQNSFITEKYTLPKLLDQCAEGWVNNIILTGTTSTQTTEVEELQQLLRAVNSNVAFLVAPKGAMTRSPDIDLVLAENAFNDEALLKARYLSCPGWAQGRYICGACSPLMADTSLQFSRPLEKTRMLDRLKGLRSAHSKHPFSGNIYLIKGTVKFTGSNQLYKMKFTVLTGELMLIPSTTQPPSPSRSNGVQEHDCSLVFTGCRLQQDRLKDLLRGCAPKKPEKKVPRTRKSLSRMEVQKIHKERHLDALPEGWFYNGAKFVSMAGDKSDTHPNLEDFLAEHLEKVNLEVDAFNAKVDKQEYHDLFE